MYLRISDCVEEAGKEIDVNLLVEKSWSVDSQLFQNVNLDKKRLARIKLINLIINYNYLLKYHIVD